MAGEEPAETASTISGGLFQAPVLQGRDIEATFQLPAAPPVALAQLPPSITGFTGRGEELAVLAGLLDPVRAAGTVVVSAVAGLAGVGKTALAVEAGHAALGRGWYRGGVLFVDLHGYDQAPVEPSQALDALLRALGVAAEHIPPTAEERAGLYRSVLAEASEPVLVIADNASAEAQVRPLLPGAGQHRVLVTSRHTLAGLGARLVDVTILDDEAAVALLDKALRAARPDDDRVSGDRQAAAGLARICGGLPLALQITAALLNADPALSAAELADDLAAESQRLERLTYDDGGGTAAPSVSAAFELSYRRLSDASAGVFRLLPVCPGPDVSTTAVAVIAGLPASEARRVLGALGRAHLVEGAAGRWQMHDLVRLYARRLGDEHADADRREQARDRLLGYYLTMTDAADQHLRALPGSQVPPEFKDRAEALAWLDAERPSLIAAVTIAASAGQDQIAMQLPLSLGQYFNWRRRFDDMLATTAVSLEAALRLHDQHGEAVARNNLGLALHEMRRFDEAIAAHQDATVIYRKTGDRHGEGTALTILGLALGEVRRFDEAIAAQQDATVIFREIGARQLEGMALTNLGLALREVRRFDEAIAAHQKAVVILRETGDRHAEGTTLNNLGLALQDLGRLEEVIAVHQDAAVIFRETGDRYREGMTLNNLGGALQLAKRFEEAATAHQAAVVIFRETGDRQLEGMALTSFGAALHEVRRFEEAVTALQDAVVIFRETGDQQLGEAARKNLDLALQGMRLLEEFITPFQDAAVTSRETGDPYREGIALNNLGGALHLAKRFEEAATAHQAAVVIFRETGDRQLEGMALISFGAALHEVRRFEEAVTALQDAVVIFRETGDQQLGEVAQKNLDLALRKAKQLEN
jgi:tetratricopeptide (TPR) repeat protein